MEYSTNLSKKKTNIPSLLESKLAKFDIELTYKLFVQLYENFKNYTD